MKTVLLEEAMEEKPASVERLKRERKLRKVVATPPAHWYKVVYFVFGYSALVFGVYLFICGIVYGRYIRLH